MRAPESKIKEAILHPEEEVRLTALAYFARSQTADGTIMPLVIQAVERYGRDKAFGILRGADDLPQTEATIRWLTGELGKDWDLDDVGNDNYCTAIGLILGEAQPALLRTEMTALPSLPLELQPRFGERLEMASWDWQTTWAAFEQFGREVRERGDLRTRDVHRGERIIEALARHRDKRDLVLLLLRRRYRGYDRNLMEWLEDFLVELAGRMRLDEAGAIIVDHLREADLSLSDSCTKALKWIGGDAVVQALCAKWQEGGADFRRPAAEIMEHIHTDLSAEKCLEFFASEKEEEVKDFLANALLGNFVSEAIEPIRQMVRGRELNPDENDLKMRLVAASTITCVPFPEYRAWYEEAKASNWGWGAYQPGRMRENFRDDALSAWVPAGATFVGDRHISFGHHLGVWEQGDVIVVRLGEHRMLDSVTVMKVSDELSSVADQADCHKLLLNFSGVEFLSSLMLGKLLMLHKKMTAKGGKLKLCDVGPKIEEVFTGTKMDQVFDIRKSEPDAFKAFSGGPEKTGQ